MNLEDVIETIRECMIPFVDRETDVTEFSYSLVPQKRIAEGGLGAGTLEAWEGLLRRFQRDYLPQDAPFQNVQFGTPAAEKTHSLELSRVCIELADILL